LSERQFTRYWNKANERHIKELQVIENKKLSIHKKRLEFAEGEIISKIETEK